MSKLLPLPFKIAVVVIEVEPVLNWLEVSVDGLEGIEVPSSFPQKKMFWDSKFSWLFLNSPCESLFKISCVL